MERILDVARIYKLHSTRFTMCRHSHFERNITSAFIYLNIVIAISEGILEEYRYNVSMLSSVSTSISRWKLGNITMSFFDVIYYIRNYNLLVVNAKQV